MDDERVSAPSEPIPEVTVETSPGAARVGLVGDIDLAVAVRLGITMRRLFVDGFVDVVVDVSQVTFMDSSALGVLVGGQRQARLFRGYLALEDPSPPVRRLLGLTAMDLVLEVRQRTGSADGAP